MKLKSKSLLYVLLVSAVAGITGCKPNSSKDELDVKTNGTDLTTTVKFYTNAIIDKVSKSTSVSTCFLGTWAILKRVSYISDFVHI